MEGSMQTSSTGKDYKQQLLEKDSLSLGKHRHRAVIWEGSRQRTPQPSSVIPAGAGAPPPVGL